MSKIKDNIIFLISGFILAIIMIFSFKCNENINNQIVTKIDTVFKEKIKIDTIYAISEKVQVKDKYHIIYKDSSKLKPKDTINLSYLRTYEDSLINDTINIRIRDTIQGKLTFAEIKYKLRLPIIIKTITDSIFINKTVNKPIYLTLQAGLETGYTNTSFNNLSPIIALKYKNKTYSYRYNFIDKSNNIGIKFDLWSK